MHFLPASDCNHVQGCTQEVNFKKFLYMIEYLISCLKILSLTEESMGQHCLYLFADIRRTQSLVGNLFVQPTVTFF